MPNLNEDLSPPVNTLGAGYPMELSLLQKGRIPTFWEDNQVMNDETFVYSESSGMTGFTPIHVPRVCRFIYAFDKTDKYADDPDDPVPGGGGTPKTEKWRVVQTIPLQPPSGFYQFRIYWEKVVVGIPVQVNYARTHPPSDEASFAGKELDLPYGDYPNYSNDGG